MRECHTVLVVEDDPDIRQVMEDVLTTEGYPVKTAANGREALEVLAAGGAPCLVLLDLMMPVMSGGEFLTVVRNDTALSAVPVVVVSAWSAEAAKVKKLTQGYIEKPVPFELLLEIVAKYCAGEIPKRFEASSFHAERGGTEDGRRGTRGAPS